jgi:hypothetical protein
MILLPIVGLDAADVPFPFGFGFLGFLAEFLFSLILRLVERGRGFQQLSLRCFAGWGAAGGLLFSVLFAFVVTVIGSGALLAICCSPARCSRRRRGVALPPSEARRAPGPRRACHLTEAVTAAFRAHLPA